MVFDATVDVEGQRLGAASIGEMAHMLAADVVQPGEAIGAGYLDHCAIGAVDDDGTAHGGTLFAERIAVMPRERRRRIV